MPRVLDVCGGYRHWPIPLAYDQWDRVIVDDNMACIPDYLCDVRGMDGVVPSKAFDAVHLSHALEHFSVHDLPLVLRMLRYACRPGGFIHIVVPDVLGAMRAMVAAEHDLDSVVYRSPAGEITYRDLIYGYCEHIRVVGEGMCHRTGFSPRLLVRTLVAAGLNSVRWFTNSAFEIHALCWRGGEGLDPDMESVINEVIRTAGERSPLPSSE